MKAATRARLLPVLFLGLLAGQADALQSDRRQPIHIEADSVSIDEQRGLSVYRGNVRLTQGSVQADADEITVHTDKGGADRMVLSGNPARLRQRPDGKEVDTEGEALRIEHSTSSGVTLFIGQARLQHGQERFSGERIEYDARGDRVSAGGDGSGRVQIVIMPKPNEEDEAGESPR